jgi:hypothetical protein
MHIGMLIELRPLTCVSTGTASSMSQDVAHFRQVAEQHFLLSVPICTNRHKPFSDPTF